MSLLSLTAPGTSISGGVLLVATHAVDGAGVPAAGSAPADDALGGRLAEALRAARAKGTAEEVVRIPVLAGDGPELVVAVGLGAPTDGGPDEEAVRRAVGAGIRALAGVDTVTVSVGDPADLRTVVAAAEGAALGRYTFTQYKTGAVSAPVGRVQILAADGPQLQAALRRITVVAQAVATVRDQVNLAPAQLYPASFADLAAQAAEQVGCAVEILDETALVEGGYGGLLAVGGGSSRPPRLVRISYRPPHARAKVALIGKGITFDTGGYNLKVPAPVNMKCDMAGAAAVLAAVVAAAQLELPVEVVAYGALAQNMISSTAYLPSDVLTIRGGKTVEVCNTDAEGRLVLADAIVRATEDEPDYLIEMSTLTGAQLIALGPQTAAVMGSTHLREQTVRVAGTVGESMWPMPLLPELRAGLDSPVADLRNVAPDRFGGMVRAGLFLGEFVPPGLEWVHIDIAGPAWNDGAEYGYTPKGGTGFGLRSLVALLTELSAADPPVANVEAERTASG